MALNEFLPFAVTDTGSNVMPQAEYEMDTHRYVGNQPGVARSTLVNKVLRQSSLMAAGVAQFMANNAADGDADVTDRLTAEEVADYLEKVVSGMGLPPGGENGQYLGMEDGGAVWKLMEGLPAGGEAGQALVMGDSGQPEWQFVTGIPLGQLTFLPYDEPPPGFVPIGTDYETVIPLEAFPKAVKMACPAAFNEEADFFYRASDVDGELRDVDGDYLVLPAAARYFFRGFDAAAGVGAYCYQGDAIRNISGVLKFNNAPLFHLTDGDALFNTSNPSKYSGAGSGNTAYNIAEFNASRVVPTADENRPMNISAFRVFMKLWDAAVTPAELDVQALVNHWTVLAAHRPDMRYLNTMTAVLYPNEGSQEAPGVLSANQRFVMPNPFPGYHVHCEAQVCIEEKWAEAGWVAWVPSNTWYEAGVVASHLLPDDTVSIRVGSEGVLGGYGSGTNVFFLSAHLASAPCRVIVTRLGKIDPALLAEAD